jgi:hypothetical protein
MDKFVDKSYVFLGVIIYIGVYKEPQTLMYWNTDFSKGPLYLILNHILYNRFEQIKRYCYISCSEKDQKKGYHLPFNKTW